MMSAGGLRNRHMFWRLVRRLLGANRGRLFVILLALGAGAAVTAALLNLQVDARRRLTTEFRSFGANIVIASREAANSPNQTLDQSVLRSVPPDLQGQHVQAVAFLYVAADAFALDSQTSSRIVVAGELGEPAISKTSTSKTSAYSAYNEIERPACSLGVRAAIRLRVKAPALLVLRAEGREETCRVDAVRSTGGSEDDQVTVPLNLAQRLAASPGRISLIQISAPGTPAAIEQYILELAQRLPELDVHGIRQFTEGEAKIYNRISGLLEATVAVVLILTGLCVMAAMTNVAMERKNDVGLMKAIGGATRRVLRLFLAEAAILGLISGALGAAAGIGLSMWLGQAVFGVAARPRLIVYPVAVALTIFVAIAGAFPLRRLASIRPASVFRGEA
jgi:putative ABC transport system permease protein